MIFALDDARARDEEEVTSTDDSIPDLKTFAHRLGSKACGLERLLASLELEVKSLTPCDFSGPQEHLNLFGVFLRFALLPVLVGGSDKGLEQGMRLQWF